MKSSSYIYYVPLAIFFTDFSSYSLPLYSYKDWNELVDSWLAVYAANVTLMAWTSLAEGALRLNIHDT